MPPIVLRELEVRCPAIRFHSRFVTVDFSLFLSLLFQDFANGVFGSSFALLIFPFFRTFLCSLIQCISTSLSGRLGGDSPCL